MGHVYIIIQRRQLRYYLLFSAIETLSYFWQKKCLWHILIVQKGILKQRIIVVAPGNNLAGRYQCQLLEISFCFSK